MDPIPTAPKKKKRSRRERAVFSDVSVPFEIRTQLQFDKESGEFAANTYNSTVGGTTVKPSASTSQEIVSSLSSKSFSRRQNKTIDGLIGQANLAYAKQKIEEAISFLREAIREDPRHPDAYNQIASIFVDQNQPSRGFEYRLLGAHLDSKTVASEWAEIGETAVKLERIEEATACYGNAVRCEPDNWFYYEKRIELLEALGLIRFAMKVRLQAAQAISCTASRVDFDWLQNLIKTAAEYYINANDEEKAMEALKIFLLRCHEFKRSADVQHLALLRMWIERERYEESVKSILALCPCIKAVNKDGTPSMNITVTNMGYQFKPFLPDTIDRFEVEEAANSLILGRLAVCMLHLGRIQPINSLTKILLKRVIHDTEDEENLLEIGRSFYKMEYYNFGMVFLEQLRTVDMFENNPEALFLCAIFEQARNNQDKALALYKHILEIQPNFVNARINLSTILQRSGEVEAALQSLMDCDLDLCTQLPASCFYRISSEMRPVTFSKRSAQDERLLVRQADVLHDQGRVDQYVRCVRMLLAPYFYAIFKFEGFMRRSRSRSTQCSVLYRAMLECLRETPIEKQIKRQGSVAFKEERPADLSPDNLHDYCLKLIEILEKQKRYKEMLEIICLASLEPKISNTGTLTFLNMTLFGCIKAGNFTLAFEYLRYLHAAFPMKTANMEGEVVEAYNARLYNAMNFVFCHHQNVCYHRFIIRAESKAPDVKQLQLISGNNSLVTGSYRHALNKYLQVWDQNRDDPLAAFLIALTFTHISCKKDISSRHMLAMRGIAFMRIYEDLRGQCQETFYNMARLFHQMSFYSGAAYFYNRVLNETQAPKVARIAEDTGEIIIDRAERYDLKRCAAHNLALIYEVSGNRALARSILEEYCQI